MERPMNSSNWGRFQWGLQTRTGIGRDWVMRQSLLLESHFFPCIKWNVWKKVWQVWEEGLNGIWGMGVNRGRYERWWWWKQGKYSAETQIVKILPFMYLHINSHCSKMYSLPSCPSPKGPQLPISQQLAVRTLRHNSRAVTQAWNDCLVALPY